MRTTFKNTADALAHWNLPSRRSGLARMLPDGSVIIFDRPSEAIGHPTTQVTVR